MMETTNSSCYENPWLDDDRSLGSIRSALLLAERTGHLKQGQKASSSVTRASHASPSVQMISLLKTIQDKRVKGYEAQLAIQHHQQSSDTKDILHASVQEQRIRQISEVNNHLQALISHKDQLISRLQQPFIGEFLKMEAAYHIFALEVIPQMVPLLADLSKQLDTLTWAGKASGKDQAMEVLLDDIANSLATLQTSFQSMSQLRNSVHRLL